MIAPQDQLAEATFRLSIERAIMEALTKNAASFADLVRSGQGAAPQQIRSALVALTSQGHIVASAQNGDAPLWRLAHDLGDSKARQRPRIRLPAPHPADFDWRFTPETAFHLAHQARSSAGRGTVAVMGAPTVFAALLELNVHAHLFERNPNTVAAFADQGFDGIFEVDLLDRVTAPDLYSVIVADPPWYPEHYRAVLLHASQLLRPGGSLFLSLPPRLTRPAARNERSELIRTSLATDFELLSLELGVLQYRTPRFEKSVLVAEGLSHADWRFGDLCSLRRTDGPASEILLLNAQARGSDGPWRYFLLGDHQIVVRKRPTKSPGPFVVQPICADGPLLRSVSRREPLRQSIDVWNDRNEAWVVSRPDVVADVLELLDSRAVDDALSQISIRHGMATAEQNVLRRLITTLTATSTEDD